MSSFESAFKYTLDNEGPYSNDPDDAGGPTKWGITQEDLARWRGTSVSADDVKELSTDEAEKVYEAYYWKPLSLDGIKSDAVATVIFDIGVNRGIVAGARYAQAVAQVNQDGHIGPISTAAINLIDESVFIKKFRPIVTLAYANTVVKKPTQLKFLIGWLNRAERLLTLIG